MKNKLHFLLIALTFLADVLSAAAQGTAFTYQGRLNNNGAPVTGSYDLTLTLFNTNASGTAIAGPVINSAVAVTNGLFTTLIDFGAGIFNGGSNWLEIAVSTNGANSFTVLSPRQQVTPEPYAITAENLAGVVGNNVPPIGAFGTIGGGQNNLNNADYATISGGQTNTIQSSATGSFIGGGDLNNIGAGVIRGSIVGGRQNIIMANASDGFIGGGVQNTIQTNVEWATITGGGNNTILAPYGSYAAISGGFFNNNGGYASVIAGGENNSIRGVANDSVIDGGYDNLIVGSELDSVFSTIGGGTQNQIQTNATYATIGGGGNNQIQPNATYAMIGGGTHNQIQPNATYATIGGGGYNQIQTNASLSTIGGGYYNQIQTNASESTVAGGGQNEIQTNAYVSTIGGGYQNTIQPNAQGATIAGGYQNVIQPYAIDSTIPGGYSNVVAGNYSFAAGQQAQALHQGAFVWADSQNTTFSSTANNQFLVRAAGGVGINTNNPNGASLYVLGNRTGSAGNAFKQSVGWFENSSVAAGSSPALRVIVDGGDSPNGALSVSATGTGRIAQFGNGLAFVASVENDGTILGKNITMTSDRNAKENFTLLDAKTVLEKVTAIPVTEWNYKDDATDKKHIGPMAQDFHAAFDLNGADDKHISVVDEGGVALAAIQGLNQKFEEQRVENATLKQQNDLLARRLNELEAVVKSLAENK